MQQRPNAVRLAFQGAPAVAITIGINLVVFLLWQLARSQSGSQVSALGEFMVENFLVSGSHIESGYLWTLVTSAYSHLDLWHIVLNMFVLWSFGVTLERLWGWRKFLIFYLICSVVGSLSHWFASSVLIESDVPALGASGAVCGLLMAFAMSYPKARILVFGIVPMPAIVGVLALFAFDVFGLVQQARGGGAGIGHGAHLGGGLAGLALWALWLKHTSGLRR